MGSNAVGFKTETVNGVEVMFDSMGWFNVSKLVKRYQPQNKNVNTYLDCKKFADVFNTKAIEYLPETREASEPMKTSQDLPTFRKSLTTLNKGATNDQRGIYAPREYLHIIIKILDPTYRVFANAILETVNIVNSGAASTANDLAITSKVHNTTTDVIDWERYRVPFSSPRNLPEDSTAYMIDRERCEWNQSDRMW